MKRNEWIKRRAGYRAFGIDKIEPEDIKTDSQSEDGEDITDSQSEDEEDITVEPVDPEAKADEDLPVIN